MPRAVQKRAAVGPLTVLDWTGDANKLRFEAISTGANDCIPVATHVDKGNMRRQIGVGQRARFLQISAPYILQG